MMLDADACHRALVARDERFDGLFFVAVKTTGVYCRPVCSARTPGRDRCIFFRTAAEAESRGFRACFRCRPELAPGAAPVDALPALVGAAVRHIEAGALNEGSIEDLASALGVTARHLRRAIHAELGISPVELAQTRRLALAKQLLHDSTLSMLDIAFASGFRSVRRFNASFRQTYGRSPTELRRLQGKARTSDSVTLRLDYRPPYDWQGIVSFLAARSVPSVERLQDGVFYRAVQIGTHRGVIAVSPLEGRRSLRVDCSRSLIGALMPLVARLRRFFDLDAHPQTIAAHLGKDARLAACVRARPGLRIPGAFDAFEASLRAILGQQVSVAAATTLAERLVCAFGEPLERPEFGLARTWPSPSAIANATEADLRALGIPAARARTLRALAAAVHARTLVLEPGADVEHVMQQLSSLPGVGDWTAHYTAMRALGWPDAFPENDLGVRKALGGVRGAEARALAEPWRPWRAYAVMHLWASLA